ncbi:MAG: AMIN domain-containing protein, partial [Holophagales bacterium]|nr:AMIN domain-containing protein [Holophagales bacterium]
MNARLSSLLEQFNFGKLNCSIAWRTLLALKQTLQAQIVIVLVSFTLVASQFSFLYGAEPTDYTRPSVVAANLELADGADNSASVKIYIPGFSGKPIIQILSSPDRLVIDFHGVYRGKKKKKNDIAKLIHPLILKARLAQFTGEPEFITRLVLELSQGVKAVVSPNSNGMVDISLRKGVGKIRASLSESTLLPTNSPISSPILSASRKEPIVAIQSAEPQDNGTQAPVDIAMEEAETALSLNESKNDNIAKLPQIGSPYIGLPSMGSIPIAPVAVQGFVSSIDTKVPTLKTAQNYVKNIGSAEPEFRGERMSISVQNAELRTILISIARAGKLNLIMDPDANSNQWTFLFEDTPWDKALDIVIKNTGLGKEISDGILRVAKIEKLKKEAEDRRALEEAKALAGDLVSLSRKLSYAKVQDVQAIIDGLKSSARAKVFTEPHTNTIIMVDLPKQVEMMMQLLDQLDVKIPQVLIEVKILEANRGWERSLGVSWPQTNSGNANLQVNGQNAAWGAVNSPSWNSVNNRSTGDNSLTAAFSPGKMGVTSIPAPS